MDRDQGCTDHTASATVLVSWIRLKLVVLSMALASCHASGDDIWGGGYRFMGNLCSPGGHNVFCRNVAGNGSPDSPVISQEMIG